MMTYAACFFLVGFVLSMVAVACNPSPFYGSFGLVAVAGFGCAVVVGLGGTFLALILVMIYVGAMLVVFVYSAALAADRYPESWGSGGVAGQAGGYLLGLMAAFSFFWKEEYGVLWGPVGSVEEWASQRGDISGVSWMYSSGGALLVISAGALLLTLFVVFEVTRALHRGAFR
ncbi:NADH dehydrogenase subunit 6 (mitochondrion) [Morone saxatilis]|uniref:NADH-ubiquinone oxidoreductase chain 6 n=1 Tax=Morone saxatilis TaxID=34816 RepID=D9MNH3_MORSA|nr:NADH dehydrogenase subunit 6 [Morone saxatilis]ADJ66721.1 NADH dehydrogenase subunit 6 [Morone saxatilis]UZC55287.1 NADH dehydrogenase subunit 6 [Morone saxatilis]